MRFPRLGVLLATATVAACGSSDKTTTEPGPSPQMSTTARAYLTEALDFEQSVFLWGSKITWPAMRADVISKTPTAQTTRDTYPAINWSIDHYFRPLGDNHSGFWPPESAPGRSDNPPNDPRLIVSGSIITPKIAYLNVPTFSGRNPTGRADSTLAEIRRLDASAPCGWIVDLRLNPGGTWAAMLTGINPLIGDGQFAGLVDGDNNKAYFYVNGSEAGIYDPSTRQNYPQVHSSSTYSLSHKNAPVALLQGPFTASAGELIILGFKGSPVPNRTFGDNTTGDTTVPAGEYLPPDSAYLNITAAVMFDRTGKVYGDVIAPDVSIPQDQQHAPTPGVRDAAVNAALAWLASRPECGGTGSVQDQPALRANIAAMPQQTGPRTRPLNVSPYFGSRTALH